MLVGLGGNWTKLLSFPLICIILWIKKNKLNIRENKILIILTIILFLGRIGHITYRFNKNPDSLEDLAIMNAKSIDLIFKKNKNPYHEKVDSYPLLYQGKIIPFEGYKYPVFQIILYAPLVLLFGLKGIYATNLIFYLLAMILIYRWLPVGRKYLGVFCFLSTDFLFTLTFNKGTNDLIATYFLLLCLYYSMQKKEISAGLNLGLCLAVKQLPGGLLLPYFIIRREWKTLFFSSFVFLLVHLIVFYDDFKNYFLNVVFFHLIRPVRESSFLVYLPRYGQSMIQILGILGLFFIFWRYRKSFKLKDCWKSQTLGITYFLLLSKMSPSHYFVWMIPVLILFIFS